MATGDIYRAMHARSLKDPEGFWAEQAAAIDWTRRWDKVLDASTRSTAMSKAAAPSRRR
jgi:propionyl-CoA synthetase